MKTYWWLLFLCSFIVLRTGAQQKNKKVKLEDTEFRFDTRKTYLKESGVPLNGKFAIKMNPYQINNEIFIDGLKHGETTIYRNKKLAEKGCYFNDLKTGKWLYFYEDGSIREQTFFKNGLRNGIDTLYENNHIVATFEYVNNHLNGWQNRFDNKPPYLLAEKTLYQQDRKIKNIRYKTVDKLQFAIMDSLFYNENNKLGFVKSFVNDTLKLQTEIKYFVKIKDIIDITATKFTSMNSDGEYMTYYLPLDDDDFSPATVAISMLYYKFVYYTDIKKTKLLYVKAEDMAYNKATFYREWPKGNLQSVTYNEAVGGWYYRDIN